MQIVGGRRERSCSVEMLLSAALLVTAVALLVTCNVPPSEGWEAAPRPDQCARGREVHPTVDGQSSGGSGWASLRGLSDI